jgi:hypothetical protein
MGKNPTKFHISRSLRKKIVPDRIGIGPTGPYAEWDMKKHEAHATTERNPESDSAIAEDVAFKYAKERPNLLHGMQTPIVRNEPAEDGKNRIVVIEWPRKPHGWVTSTLLVDPKDRILLRVISQTVGRGA